MDSMHSGDYTMMPLTRLNELHQIAARVADLPGALVECGAWNGGSAAVLAHGAYRKGRPVWLFDSWQGLPKPGKYDGVRAQDEYARHNGVMCVGNATKPAEAFRVAGLLDCELHIVPGWFAKTVPGAQTGNIALLHVDADWYESVKLCLTTFYPRIVAGGLLIIDDYGHWPGCKRATDEVLGVAVRRLVHVDYTCVYMVKGKSP
jgi:hypothetical protein